MGASLVLLLVSMTLLAVQEFVAAVPPPTFVDDKWHVHVANGLSNGNLLVHCKSKETDLGEHNLGHGAEIQWSFRENVWGTTLFWCFLRKSGGSVSFEVFWHETEHYWLHYRCTKAGTCFWTAKDDGIYLKNIPDSLEELIHKWGA